MAFAVWSVWNRMTVSAMQSPQNFGAGVRRYATQRLHSMSLIHQIAKGAFWAGSAQWIVQLTQFGVSIVLAHLLTPGDYGLVGLALVYIGFINLFSNLGMGPALIQRPEIDDSDICTAFWAGAAVSLMLFATSLVAAPWVAQYFATPELTTIIRVTAVSLLVSPLNAVLYSLLTRYMKFRSLATVDVSAALFSSAIALGGAFAGLGVWALVLAQIGNSLLRLPLLLHFNRWTPSWRFDRGRFKSLFAFGGNVVCFNIINYFARNLDKVIIGKLLGPVPLGYYDMAYQVMLKPLQSITSTVGAPLFPALSSIRNDKAQASEVYRQVTTYIALITFPVMAGIAVVSDDFVLLVLGAKWMPTVPVLQILCFVGAIQSVLSTVGDVYLSQGRSDIMLKWSLVVTPLFGAAFYIGSLWWGIVGVAACYALLHIPMWIVAHSIANPLIELPARRFWSSLLPVASMTLVMSGAVFAVQKACDILGLEGFSRLVVAIIAGVISYSAWLLWTSNPDVVAARTEMIRRLPFVSGASE